ncbi:hypothetical protein OSB04_013091 [Centaurea solstitialis]|uniref:Uncharacterized protein n=1 Tax=Centaurea solstitialis TaxID=347529 RepID=A0AA38TVM5_9ASTR|nr:hypothetical protein OSB04_013091 [Centaurea solstitialis]
MDVESVSEVVQHIPCLKQLDIFSCPKLKDLPNTTDPSSLRIVTGGSNENMVKVREQENIRITCNFTCERECGEKQGPTFNRTKNDRLNTWQVLREVSRLQNLLPEGSRAHILQYQNSFQEQINYYKGQSKALITSSFVCQHHCCKAIKPASTYFALLKETNKKSDGKKSRLIEQAPVKDLDVDI